MDSCTFIDKWLEWFFIGTINLGLVLIPKDQRTFFVDCNCLLLSLIILTKTTLKI